jgi:3-oxoacyl-[acyl-carrier-protein] synthase-1
MSILYGFNSLELVSARLCRPFDERRDGINIGEGCGYALLAR